MAEYEKELIRRFLGMHRRMEHFLGQASSFTAEQCWSPPVDVFETETSYIVKTEIAGLAREDVEVEFNDGQLTIEGCRHEFCTEPKVSCRQMEIPYGHFRRTIFVSRNIDGDNITASYTGGFLEIRLPRAHAPGQKKVEIKVE